MSIDLSPRKGPGGNTINFAGSSPRQVGGGDGGGVPAPKPQQIPQRQTLFGQFITRDDTGEYVPQAVQVTKAGQIKILPLMPRLELIALVQVKAAGTIVLTARGELTDVLLMPINVIAGQSAYSLYYGFGASPALAKAKALAVGVIVGAGQRDLFPLIGMSKGDVIQASCTADNDFNVAVCVRRYKP